MISQLAVVLLGHRSIEAAQTCFEMANRYVELCRCEGSCERRVDIARNDDEIWAEVDEHLLEFHEGATRLGSVGARADTQLDVRGGKGKLAEEDVVHLRVVMLARVY